MISTLPSKIISILSGHTAPVTCLKFNQNGNYLCSSSRDKTLQLWNTSKGSHVYTFEGVHFSDLLDIDISNDNSSIVSGGSDKLVLLWDVESATAKAKFRGHTLPVTAVSFNSHSSVILSGGVDKTVRIWDIRARTFTPIQIFSDAKDTITSIHCTDYSIITSSVDGNIRTYDLRNNRLIEDYFKFPILDMKLSHNKSTLLLLFPDNSIQLIDRSTGKALNSYSIPKPSYLSTIDLNKNSFYKQGIDYNEKDDIIFISSMDGSIHSFDILSSTPLSSLPPSEYSTYSTTLAYTLCSSLYSLPFLAVPGKGGRILLYSTEEYEEKKKEKEEEERKSYITTAYMETRKRLPMLKL